MPQGAGPQQRWGRLFGLIKPVPSGTPAGKAGGGEREGRRQGWGVRGGGASAARGAQTPPPNRPGQLSPSLLRKPREQTPQSRLQAGVGGEAGSKPALGGAGEGGSREVPSACPREKLPEPAQPLPAKAGTLRGCLQAHLTGFTPSSKRFPPDTPIPAVPGQQPHPPWPSRCPSLWECVDSCPAGWTWQLPETALSPGGRQPCPDPAPASARNSKVASHPSPGSGPCPPFWRLPPRSERSSLPAQLRQSPKP